MKNRDALSYNINSNALLLLNLAIINKYKNVINFIYNYYSLDKAIYINKVNKYTSRTTLFSAIINNYKNVI